MAAWKKTGRLMRHRDRLLRGFAERGITRNFGEKLFEQIKGFGEYGFPESHAASFALLVYVSSWQKAHFPVYFACALLNSQPMGFYSPSTIMQDAQRHGVTVRDIDVTRSDWDSTLEHDGMPEGKPALRLGLRLVKGLSEKAAKELAAARPFEDYADFFRRVPLRKNELEALAEAGALESLVSGRRQALRQTRTPRVGGLFEKARYAEPSVMLRPLRAAEQLLLDYQRKGLSVSDHPLRHLRAGLAKRGVVRAVDLPSVPHGSRVNVAGVVLTRQQPGTASGVVFITLEDETGFSNLVLFRHVFERYLLPARNATLLFAHGTLEKASNVIHVMVEELERLDLPGQAIPKLSRDFH
jgi:error-prone DNA polymerase